VKRPLRAVPGPRFTGKPVDPWILADALDSAARRRGWVAMVRETSKNEVRVSYAPIAPDMLSMGGRGPSPAPE